MNKERDNSEKGLGKWKRTKGRTAPRLGTSEGKTGPHRVLFTPTSKIQLSSFVSFTKWKKQGINFQ